MIPWAIERADSMDLNRIDLNLLIIFEAVMKERSVTRAAKAVGLSQPAVSSALSRLRQILDDPLLIRTNGGMLPTPRAERLIGPIEEALLTVRASLSERRHFDHLKAQRTFHLLLSDIGEIVYLPQLVEHVAQVSPGIRFRVSSSGPRHDADLLRSGAADLAIGTLPHLRHGLEQERLFTGAFGCMLRTNHPVIGDTLSMQQYLDAEHATIAPGGGTDGIVEQTLSAMGITRKIALTVPHFLAVPIIVARTNLVVTVPERLGRILTQGGEIRLLPLPFPMHSIEIRQYWHRRYDNDAGNRWLRDTIKHFFGDSAAAH